ncbi:hypothetical protein LTS18_002016, partial [Coniosporium uncinatum]
AMETQSQLPQRPRAQRACVICHKKKVKCDIDLVTGGRCTNCERDDYECQPRERKRKRFTLSPSPPVRTQHERRKSSVNGLQQPAVSATEPFGYTVPGPESISTETTVATQVAGPVKVSLSEQPSPNISYLGRSEYISADLPVDQGGEAVPQYLKGPSEKDIETLHLQQVFDLPPRPLRESILDSFWKRCWPWTPIVERAWVEGKTHDQVSPLLMQAMLLAGSRVSPTPSAQSIAAECYRKAKTLFYLGAEKDPITILVSTCLLFWMNPEGPEHISIDTSGFWLRLA